MPARGAPPRGRAWRRVLLHSSRHRASGATPECSSPSAAGHAVAGARAVRAHPRRELVPVRRVSGLDSSGFADELCERAPSLTPDHVQVRALRPRHAHQLVEQGPRERSHAEAQPVRVASRDRGVEELPHGIGLLLAGHANAREQIRVQSARAAARPPARSGDGAGRSARGTARRRSRSSARGRPGRRPAWRASGPRAARASRPRRRTARAGRYAPTAPAAPSVQPPSASPPASCARGVEVGIDAPRQLRVDGDDAGDTPRERGEGFGAVLAL